MSRNTEPLSLTVFDWRLSPDRYQSAMATLNPLPWPVALAAAREWSLWEANVATLLPNPELLEEFADPSKALPFARICVRFFRDRFYLEEGQLLANIDRIRHIPTVMVQGRYDICTPPTSAWEVKKAWPKAELWIVPDAGHSASEPGIIDGLVRATDKFAGGDA